ncbi:MAG: hypothetical protein M1827_004995 [Pycnora praestabilis]|nr:MAG: hypothetical protein M1827_004995 [Pycnora praestabilis]
MSATDVSTKAGSSAAESSRRPKSTSSKSSRNSRTTADSSSVETPRVPLKGRVQSAPVVPRSKATPSTTVESTKATRATIQGHEKSRTSASRKDDGRSQKSPRSAPIKKPVIESEFLDESGQISERTIGITSGERALRNRVGSPQEATQGKNMREISIVVLGAPKVGKTTFIQHALYLRQPPSSMRTTKKMAMQGLVHVVNIIELDVDSIEIRAGQRIEWPGFVDGKETPRIDGVLALYDVLNKDSIVQLSDVIKQPKATGARRRANTSAPRSSSRPSNHNRALSEISSSLLRSSGSGNTGQGPGSGGANAYARPNNRQATIRSNRHPSLSQTLTTCARASQRPDAAEGASETDLRSPLSSEDRSAKSGVSVVFDSPFRASQPIAESKRKGPVSSFFGMEEEQEDERRSLSEIPILDREQDAISEKPPKDNGSTLEDLVDRLLAQPMSKADSKFAAIFLCLYRKFAAPEELLDNIIIRFEDVNNGPDPQMIRTSTQVRHLSIMAQWVAAYPGDFAHSWTRRRMNQFVAKLSSNRVFAVAAKEMAAHMELVAEDDDTNWAFADKNRKSSRTLGNPLTSSSNQSSGTTLNESPSFEEVDRRLGDAEADEDSVDRSARNSGAPSSSSSMGTSTSASGSSFQTLLGSLESARREARTLKPIPRTPLTKVQWHQFMDIPDEDIARELTRIDWILFSSIRPRDLVRHVSLTVDQKEKCRCLENVDRMIGQFNHVAYWVANLILLRDKPKHRAKVLEKWMVVAWKLRQLNNYNALGAVIAGINGTSVHRLTQTRELVSVQSQKDFMRLEILMGTQKSHFAYRLAWENTSSERIPFLPLHRRDLVSAEQGNRTFTNEEERRINWKKFEVMGEVIVGFQKSQGTPYPDIPRSLDVQRLVLEGRFAEDDDELYERSVQLEEPGNNTSDPRKKFSWFQR